MKNMEWKVKTRDGMNAFVYETKRCQQITKGQGEREGGRVPHCHRPFCSFWISSPKTKRLFRRFVVRGLDRTIKENFFLGRKEREGPTTASAGPRS